MKRSPGDRGLLEAMQALVAEYSRPAQLCQCTSLPTRGVGDLSRPVSMRTNRRNRRALTRVPTLLGALQRLVTRVSKPDYSGNLLVRLCALVDAARRDVPSSRHVPGVLDCPAPSLDLACAQHCLSILVQAVSHQWIPSRY